MRRSARIKPRSVPALILAAGSIIGIYEGIKKSLLLNAAAVCLELLRGWGGGFWVQISVWGQYFYLEFV